jgi:hypothetical protein
MKQLIYKLTDLQYTLSGANRATLLAKGETSTPGWTEVELGNERIGDGILHLDFIGQPAEGIEPQVTAPVSAERDRLLGSQPQDITVHSATNELSVQLPAMGDPK